MTCRRHTLIAFHSSRQGINRAGTILLKRSRLGRSSHWHNPTCPPQTTTTNPNDATPALPLLRKALRMANRTSESVEGSAPRGTFENGRLLRVALSRRDQRRRDAKRNFLVDGLIHQKPDRASRFHEALHPTKTQIRPPTVPIVDQLPDSSCQLRAVTPSPVQRIHHLWTTRVNLA